MFLETITYQGDKKMRIPIKDGKNRVVVLLRASSKKQTDQNNDFDIPQQKSILLPFVEEEKLKLIKVFVEGGVSGFKTRANDRDAIMDILQMAKNDEFDILLIHMSDRLGRIADETPLIVATLNQYGKMVYSYCDGEISAKDHMEKLITYIRYWQAEGESRKTSRRVSDIIRQTVKEGRFRGGSPADGYIMVNRGRNNYKGKPVLDIEIDQERAPMIRKIYELAREHNYGCRRISQYLNDQGYRTKKGGLWSAGQVRQILNNPLYKGYYVLKAKNGYNGYLEEIVSPCMPELIIVPEDEWNATHEVMDKRTTRQKGTRVTTHGVMKLAGLMYCGYCGKKITSFHLKSKRKTNGEENKVYMPKYRCSSYMYPQEVLCEGKVTYSAKKVEDTVISALKKYISTLSTQDLSLSYLERLDEQIKLAKTELGKLQAAQTKAIKELSVLKDEIVKSLMGESQFESTTLQGLLSKKESESKERETQLEIKKSVLEDLLRNRRGALELDSKMENWETDFDVQNPEGQKAMLFQVVDRIDLYRNKVEIAVNIKMDMFIDGLSEREKLLDNTDDFEYNFFEDSPNTAVGDTLNAVELPTEYGKSVLGLHTIDSAVKRVYQAA